MNFLQVALLRWYHANLTASFTAGPFPFGLAFDGANVGENIWVANTASNDVTELRANNGAKVGTFPVGTAPENVAFDGGNVWVSNSVSNTVSKL